MASDTHEIVYRNASSPFALIIQVLVGLAVFIAVGFGVYLNWPRSAHAPGADALPTASVRSLTPAPGLNLDTDGTFSVPHQTVPQLTADPASGPTDAVDWRDLAPPPLATPPATGSASIGKAGDAATSGTASGSLEGVPSGGRLTVEGDAHGEMGGKAGFDFGAHP